jgi:hypothetical protein
MQKRVARKLLPGLRPHNREITGTIKALGCHALINKLAGS